MERRHRRTRKEKLEDELKKTAETIAQYTAALEAMEEKRRSLAEEIENERIREVTRLMKEKNLSVDQLKDMIGGASGAETVGQSA